MKFAFNVPGYVQGHRFSQDSQYYDSVNKRFRDLSGFGRFGGDVEWRAGTPAFSNHGANNREGLLLDNSCQWQFVPAIPWEGTMVLVFMLDMNTAGPTVQLYPWLFGGDPTTPTSNGLVRTVQSAGARSIFCQSYGAVGTQGIAGLTDDTMYVVAFSRSQLDRKARSTTDAVTVTASAAVATPSPTNGEGVAWASTTVGGTLLSRLCRLGNNSGTDGDTTVNATDRLYVFEQHFFKGDVLSNNLADLKAFFDTLKAYYAIA